MRYRTATCRMCASISMAVNSSVAASADASLGATVPTISRAARGAVDRDTR